MCICINNYLTNMSQILPLGNIPFISWLCTDIFPHLIEYAVKNTLWGPVFGRYLLWHNMPAPDMLTWFTNTITQNFLQMTLVNQTSPYWIGVIEIISNPVDPHKCITASLTIAYKIEKLAYVLAWIHYYLFIKLCCHLLMFVQLVVEVQVFTLSLYAFSQLYQQTYIYTLYSLYTYEWQFTPPVNHTDTTRMVY